MHETFDMYATITDCAHHGNRIDAERTLRKFKNTRVSLKYCSYNSKGRLHMVTYTRICGDNQIAVLIRRVEATFVSLHGICPATGNYLVHCCERACQNCKICFLSLNWAFQSIADQSEMPLAVRHNTEQKRHSLRLYRHSRVVSSRLRTVRRCLWTKLLPCAQHFMPRTCLSIAFCFGALPRCAFHSVV